MAKIKNPTVVIAGGEQPILFAPQVSQSLNVVQWQNNPSNGGFPVSLIARLDGTIVTSQDNTYDVQESDYGKTFSVVASAANFVGSFSDITLTYFYTITKTVTNGTMSGAVNIEKNGNATITISPTTGYLKPYNNGDITVTGADYTYSRNTGTISLSNPTGNVSISVTCPSESIPTNYITFSSDNPFSVKFAKDERMSSIILNISTDKVTWSQWDFSQISAVESSNKYYIYVCGRNNRALTSRNTALSALYSGSHFVFTSGSNIDCSGNVESLLDWVSVDYGEHPAINDATFTNLFSGTPIRSAPNLPLLTIKGYSYAFMFSGCTSLIHAPDIPATSSNSDNFNRGCFRYMFQGCTSLITAPSSINFVVERICEYMFWGCSSLTSPPSLPVNVLKGGCYESMFLNCTSLSTPPSLPSTSLSSTCYRNMFRGCTNLIALPELPANTMDSSCYNGMFYECSNIKISSSQSGDYVNSYRIPSSGTGTIASQWNNYMFYGTGGTFTGDPSINTTYYTSNTVIPAA